MVEKIKKNKFKIFTYLFCAFTMALFTIVSFSSKTYAYEVIDNDNTPVLKSSNLLDNIDIGYAYRASNGVKFQTSGYICSTNYIIFDYYSYINITLDLNNTTDINCFITLYDSNYTYIKSIQWVNTDNTIFNNGLSCRFNINASDRMNSSYFTFTCATNHLNTYNVMINDGILPLQYEPYNITNYFQYLTTYNEIERYYYYEQYILASNCNYTNNGSYVAVAPNAEMQSTSLQFVNMYKYLKNNIDYTFHYDGVEEAILQVIYNNQTYNVPNHTTFQWKSEMSVLRIYFKNTTNEIKYAHIGLYDTGSASYLRQEIERKNQRIDELLEQIENTSGEVDTESASYNAGYSAGYRAGSNGNNELYNMVIRS